MSRADGVLVVSLTYRWFGMIASGEKLEEYRGVHWAKMLLSSACYHMQWRHKVNPDAPKHYRDFIPWHHEDFVNFHTIRAQRAYTGVWLERKIRRIRWGKPRPEWSGDTVTGECFVIELEPG